VSDCEIVQLHCVSCRTSIELSVVNPFGDATHAANVHTAVNELLVDFGWVPGDTGPYCPVHAAALR
jgi:hypothetical protein